MKTFFTVLIAAVGLGLIGLGVYYFVPRYSATTPGENTATPTQSGVDEQATTTLQRGETAVIGTSVEGRDIVAYHYGTGSTELLFVGGIHGGYEWNTTLVAYNLVDQLKAHPEAIPENISVTVIPVLNPDGLYKVVGTTERFTQADVPASAETISGRFNGNEVDLNRNFDCDWKAKGTWQSKTVSGGATPFSEPESQAIKAYVEKYPPTAVVVWYSAAGGVFASNCHGGVLPETTTITKLYANASGYPAYQNFNFYEITGDMVNWLAKEGVPAISVLLTTHSAVEWDKNWAGIEALLEHYTTQ